MGAGDRQHLAPRQHVFAQPFRAGRVRAAAVEQGLDRRIAPRQCIADHDRIAVGREVFGQIALLQRDAERLELRGHGRVYRLVTAFDIVAEFARERGDAAHEGAGNAEDVEFQERIPCALRGRGRGDGARPA
jgi:hypothetical protein